MDVFYSEHTSCHQAECLELLDVIKAVVNDSPALAVVLTEALSASRHSLTLIETISSVFHPSSQSPMSSAEVL